MTILPIHGEGDRREAMVEGVLLPRCAARPTPSTSLRLVPLPARGEDL